MDGKLSNSVFRGVVIAFLALSAGLLAWLVWSNYQERYTVTEEDNGTSITRLVSANEKLADLVDPFFGPL